jgi:hypothetical protein
MGGATLSLHSNNLGFAKAGVQVENGDVAAMPHWNITLHNKPLCLSLWCDKGQVKR